MITDSFNRLPDAIRQLVLDGLDKEIQSGFDRAEKAESDANTPESTVNILTRGIARTSKLRDSLTGESTSQR